MQQLVLRQPDVQRLTQLSRQQIFNLRKAGEFPMPIKLGGRLLAWRAEDIVEWVKARPEAEQINLKK